LIYEVYLLVYYIPKSVTTYVSKQYEIITLIVIRRIFKDLSNLELSQDWLNIKSDRQFTYDIILSIILFYLIYLFKNNITVYVNGKIMYKKERFESFVGLKKTIAVFLVPTLIGMAAYNLFKWSNSLFNRFPTSYINFKNINNVFFEDFFTLLIVVDVLLLLISFFYSDSFQKVMRNSGFIISTILIRLSFATEGSVNNVLILSSIIFGLLILLVHNQFEKKEFLSLEVK
jgi:multisubunit Na+/H+ antiporter MnhB subunit